MTTATGILVLLAAAAVTAVLIVLLQPVLQRYALARPNARSSHSTPTPQGGGIAVMLAAIAALAGVALLAPNTLTEPWRLAIVFAAAGALAIVGATDDIRPLEAWPRLALQAIAVVVVLALALPADLRVLPMLPWWVERVLMTIAVLWLVNLVNFMDGIDWMTVAEVVPVTAALAYFGWRGALPADATTVAVVLCGAMLGFAPFNKPVAQLFLGDVGSLPIGLLLGWLLVRLAENHLAAAVLLPLYYVADATITLLRRLVRGDNITQAHRSHYYQQAVDHGMSVYAVIGGIFTTNVALAVLASATLTTPPSLQVVALLCGAGVVTVLLLRFSRAKRR